MKLEKQVTSLKLSKKLKELGVKQESWFLWELDDTKEEWVLTDQDKAFYSEREDRSVSAFTASELGEMLPSIVRPNRSGRDPLTHHVVGEKGMLTIWLNRTVDGVRTVGVNYDDDRSDDGFLFPGVFAATMPNALAEMFIYLIENKLV